MKISEIKFEETTQGDSDTIYVAYTDLGRITVLDRMTGWGYNTRDTETGFKDNSGKFWLCSGMFDIRDFPDLTIAEAVDKIKENANTCVVCT